MHEPSIEQIEEARNVCAKVIAMHGEKYLPIFERLDNELHQRKKQDCLLQKALKIATQNDTHFATQLRSSFNTLSKFCL